MIVLLMRVKISRYLDRYLDRYLGRYLGRCFEHGRFVGFMDKEHCTPLDLSLHDCIADVRQDI